MISEKHNVIIIGCDFNKNSGEGVLANYLSDEIKKKYSNTLIYRDFLTKIFSKISFLKNRVMPFWLCLIALGFKLKKRKVVYLNYCPIWNPFIFFISRFGVMLGPITGSESIIPKKRSLSFLIRLYILPQLSNISKFLITKDLKLWVATPSVQKKLHKKNASIIYGRPTLKNIRKNKSKKQETKALKIIIYSSNHPMKNHVDLKILLKYLSNSGINITVISNNFREIPGINVIPILSKEEFDKELKSSTHYLSLSYEDNGITFYEAINFGLELIFPKESPKSKYYKSSIDFSIYNLVEASNKIKKLNLENHLNAKFIKQNKISLNKEALLSKRSIKEWISWI